MGDIVFPWRPLGRLLVEKRLIPEARLEEALAAQRRHDQPLGRILVEREWISLHALLATLAEQHGVGLGDLGAPPSVPSLPNTRHSTNGWVPLGHLLVEKGLITRVKLKQALAEQREREIRLGDVLLERDWISPPLLAQVIAEQHGLELDDESAITAYLGSAAEGCFRVSELRGGVWETLRTSPTFLDATDSAFDIIYDRDPELLEIVRSDGAAEEVVWSYNRAERAFAGVASDPDDIEDDSVSA